MAKDDFFDDLGDLLDPFGLFDLDGDGVHDIAETLMADDFLDDENYNRGIDDDYGEDASEFDEIECSDDSEDEDIEGDAQEQIITITITVGDE